MRSTTITLLTTVAVGFLIPATAQGQVDPTSACEPGNLAEAHREFTYASLRLVSGGYLLARQISDRASYAILEACSRANGARRGHGFTSS